MRIRIKSLPSLLAAGLLMAGASAASGQADEEAVPVDGYAAKVNKHVILQSDVDMAAGPHLRNLARTFEARMREMQLTQESPVSEDDQRELMQEFNDMTHEARAKALEALIERFLIVEEFKRQEGELPDRMVQDQIQRIVEDRFEGDRSKLVESLSQFQMTFVEFKEQTKEDLIATLLRRQELSNLPGVSPLEVYGLYQAREDRYRQPEEVKLSGIALAQGETDEEKEAKHALAAELLQELLDGADFAGVARAKSEGRRAEKGGDWGWKITADLRPELAAAVKDAASGQVSDIVEVTTDQGGWYYIVRVDARKDAMMTPFEQVRDDLRAELEDKAREETYRAWIERLKKHHYVKTY